VIDWLTYWYLLPVGIMIAFFYTSTGISGANFWVPVYLLWLKIDPLTGFWLSLISMIFGSIGGLAAHSRQKTINFSIAKKYLLITIPFAVLGAVVIPYLEVRLLLIAFGTFVLAYSLILLFKAYKKIEIAREKHNKINFLSAAIGGFSTGLISVGLGKLILPHTIRNQKINHHSVAIGTTLVVVFITSLVVVLARLNSAFIVSLNEEKSQIISILIYVVPGVLLGSQLGPVMAKKLHIKHLRVYVALLLFIVGVLMFVRVFS
jgi:uncharacterized membrane protein YfcA